MFNIKSRRILTLMAAILTPALISGCSLHEETKLTQNRIQVQQNHFVTEVPTHTLDTKAVAGLAAHYDRHGDGPIDLNVTYDPQSAYNTAMKASEEAGRIAKIFRNEGIKTVQPGITPVQQQGDESVSIISYTSYDALAPKDCGTMAGYNPGTKIEADPEYKLGCTIDTVFARQIARPKDLMGQGRSDRTSDGRRASNISDVYRSGQQNEALKGETSTGE